MTALPLSCPSFCASPVEPQLALFHHSLLAQEHVSSESEPNREQLHRRDAIVPAPESDRENNGGSCSSGTEDTVFIVPHLQVSSDASQRFNRAISPGGGLLADLQRASLASHLLYTENGTAGAETGEHRGKNRSPWILRRLYEWSHRAKSRELSRRVHAALGSDKGKGTGESGEGQVGADGEDNEEDEQLAQMAPLQWQELFALDTAQVELLTERERRRLRAVWELLHSELVFLTRQLLVLRNVYKEPLKKCQVEGCLLGVEPELLFGNLDQLCRISRRFCRTFLSLLDPVKSTGAPFACTDLIVQLFQKFYRAQSPISAYKAYCINYKASIEYLGTVRQREERFVEFEGLCMNDSRCGRLQMEDLLISPLQRITRLPILLREILRFTDPAEEREAIERVLEQMNESLRSIDDSVQWLHNFERLQQLQRQLVWPPVGELEPRTLIPDFMKSALSRQFCENLLAHPRRKLLHEGPLEYIENGRSWDCYCFLFNDMFMVTKIKKVAMKSKKNSSHLNNKEFYIVHRQPVPLDSCVFCDAESDVAAQQNMILKNAFVIIHLTRYCQVTNVCTLQALNKREKEIWIEKFQEGIQNYEHIQLKDMLLHCTPLFTSLTLRRSSSTRSSHAPLSAPHSTSSPNSTPSRQLNKEG